VVAVESVCPHRGGALAKGTCHFRGTVTCPYHGWTFDESGAAVAVLGEGPHSRIPSMPDAKARIFPTRTLKGVVWIWMGGSEPADIREDVPPQFFDEGAFVQHSVTVWNCNWRVAFENLLDAHVFYVHRDSVHLMMLGTSGLMTMSKLGPRRPRPKVVNGRGLSYEPAELAFISAFAGNQRDGDEAVNPADQLQDEYPSLGGAKWPQHTRRLYWHKVVDLVKKAHPKPVLEPMVTNPEWRDAHLPATYQVDYHDHVYSRLTVPIDEETSRIFYFHTTRPETVAERVKDTLYFELFQNWMMNYNFSGQDAKVIVNQSYDHPEMFSATDTFPLTLRRFILENGRDFVLKRKK
jgi:nitrite reductase/ring-hydroxylating ferredoxin subunit